MEAYKIKALWFITCLLCISAYGQEVADNGKDIFIDGYLYEWCIWERYDDGRTRLHYITQNQDKVFNDLTYHSADITLYKQCYWRYEDNKLYRYDEAEGTEYVLLDFGLSVGDVFEMRDGRKMRLAEVVDTILSDRYEDGREYGAYRLLKVFNVEDEADCDEWLEGFGSMSTSILSEDELGDGVRESHLLWTSDFPILNIFNTDNLKTQLMTEEKTGRNLIPDSLHCEFVGDTLIVSGHVFSACAIDHYLLCDVQDNVIHFRISPVKVATCTGVFWFTARFPGFNEGKYTFSYSGWWNQNKIEKEIVCGNIVDTDSRYFPTGTKWKEVVAESGMPLDTLNGAIEYEIGTDTTINDRIYKKVLRNGVVQDLFLREQDGKVVLASEHFAEELLLYDFNWNSNDLLYMEFLHDNEGELTKELISYKTADAYTTTVDGKTFSCIQDNSGVVVRDIGRVLDWNRTGCVLGYKQPEPVLPGLLAFKLLWMRRGGIEVFRSENAGDFTNTSQSVTTTQTETKPSAIYLPSGQRTDTNTPSKGIHIIRMSDGTVKKVYTNRSR